jgi:hypothetical protein
MINQMNLTRWIFSDSLFVGLFWVLGSILEAANQKTPASVFLVAFTILIAFLIFFVHFKAFSQFLKKAPNRDISISKYYIINIIIAYFLLVPAFGVLTYLFILAKYGSKIEGTGIALALVAIWFPLWWFIPVGKNRGHILNIESWKSAFNIQDVIPMLLLAEVLVNLAATDRRRSPYYQN